MKIFILDDERIVRVSLSDDLKDEGHSVTEFSEPNAVFAAMQTTLPDLIITDLKMPNMSGIELLKKVKSLQKDIKVIVMTAYGTIDIAVEALKSGAYDFITKPFKTNELLTKIEHINELNELKTENKNLKKQLSEKYDFSAFIGQSKQMNDVKNQIKLILNNDTTVLITGETGTGKEVIANIIHYNGTRKAKPYIKVSCGILAREIIESELFGHEKGAFTGAETAKPGRFELADTGTLFLDDIDDMPLDLQVKLLRALEQGEIERLGSTQTKKINVRIIAATKVNLKKLVEQGKFREDLYYRLNIFPINIPPLRQRSDDIPLLVKHFISKSSINCHCELTDDILQILNKHAWQGNVRELKNIVERLIILGQNNTITPDMLPSEFFTTDPSLILDKIGNMALPEAIQVFEEEAIKKAMLICGNNKNKAAEYLGIPASTLRSKIEKM